VDTTLNVRVVLNAGGNLAQHIRAEQQALQQLTRQEGQMGAAEQQRVQRMRGGFATGVAMVAATVVGNKAVLQGLQRQAQGEREVMAIRAKAADAARSMLPQKGDDQLARASLRRDLVAQLAQDQQNAKHNALGSRWRANELDPDRPTHGGPLRDQLRQTAGEEAAAKAPEELAAVRQARLRAQGEAMRLDKADGYKQGNKYPEEQEQLLREQHKLTADVAGVEERRAKIGDEVLKGQEAQAAAAARVRLEGQQGLNAQRGSTTEARERAKYLATPEGIKAARERLRLQQEETKEQRKARYAQNVAEHGRLVGGLMNTEDRLKRLGDSIAGVGQTAQVAFAAMTAGIGGVINAASPSHFATVTGSLESVAISAGKAFLPIADDVSRWLQRTAVYVESLDPVLKANTARWLMWAAAAVGVVAILPSVVSSVLAVVSVVRLAASALMLMVANPVLLGLAAVATVAVAIGAAFYYSREQIASAADQIGELQRKQREFQQQGGAAAVGALPPDIQARVAELTLKGDKAAIEERNKLLEESQKKVRERIEKAEPARAGAEIEIEAALRKAQIAATNYQGGPSFGETDAAKAARESAQAEVAARLEAIRQKYDKQGVELRFDPKDVERLLYQANPTPFTERLKIDAEAYKRLRAAAQLNTEGLKTQDAAISAVLRGGGNDDLRRSLRGLPQPAYHAIQELQSQIQLKALSPEGDLDRDNQIKQLQSLEKLGVLLEKIETNTSYRGRSSLHLPYSGLVPE